MFVSPRVPVAWEACRPWRGVEVQRCDDCGLQVLQRLDAGAASLVCGTLLVLEVPRSVVLEELLESLAARECWLGGLRRVSAVSDRAEAAYAALLDVGDARSLSACAAALAWACGCASCEPPLLPWTVPPVRLSRSGAQVARRER